MKSAILKRVLLHNFLLENKPHFKLKTESNELIKGHRIFNSITIMV